ncbi:hypothetical protein STEG23_005348 [Scotinomys teguina]
MQVSIACTEHNLKSRNGEDRLLSKQSSTAPNVVNAARAKFRTVAIIARSLGTFTPQHHISLKESTAKQTGMKYSHRERKALHGDEKKPLVAEALGHNCRPDLKWTPDDSVDTITVSKGLMPQKETHQPMGRLIFWYPDWKPNQKPSSNFYLLELTAREDVHGPSGPALLRNLSCFSNVLYATTTYKASEEILCNRLSQQP